MYIKINVSKLNIQECEVIRHWIYDNNVVVPILNCLLINLCGGYLVSEYSFRLRTTNLRKSFTYNKNFIDDKNNYITLWDPGLQHWRLAWFPGPVQLSRCRMYCHNKNIARTTDIFYPNKTLLSRYFFMKMIHKLPDKNGNHMNRAF